MSLQFIFWANDKSTVKRSWRHYFLAFENETLILHFPFIQGAKERRLDRRKKSSVSAFLFFPHWWRNIVNSISSQIGTHTDLIKRKKSAYVAE